MTVREKQCVKCQQFKPSTEFKRKLTIAQSRAMLRNPKINSPYIADSKRCKQCQLELKRHTPLTIKEIRSKVSTGDIHHVIGELKIEQMRKAIPERRARVMKEYWEKQKAKPIKELHTNLQKQVAKYAARYHAYKATPKAQHAMIEQHRWNYEQAKQIRTTLMERANNGGSIDPTTKIVDLIKPKPKGEA